MEPVTQVHDSIIEEFREVCRFCKETVEHHADGVCLFEPTLFTPMTPDEWAHWRESAWRALAGEGYIQDWLRQQSFARQVLEAQPKGTVLKMHGPTYIRQEDGPLWLPPPPPVDDDRLWKFFEAPSVSASVDVSPRICRNCNQERETHLDGKCLFEASVFEPMTMEELMKWATVKLGTPTGISFGTTTGRMSSRSPNMANIPRAATLSFKQEFLGQFLSSMYVE